MLMMLAEVRYTAGERFVRQSYLCPCEGSVESQSAERFCAGFCQPLKVSRWSRDKVDSFWGQYFLDSVILLLVFIPGEEEKRNLNCTAGKWGK